MPLSGSFIADIRRMIDETRASVAVTVNAGMTMLYWRIGKRINSEVLKGKRADGAEIVPVLSRQLMSEYGNSFAEKNLRRMIQFTEVFQDKKIVVSLIRQLSWTHFIAIISLKDSLQREFYSEMCRIERWSVRTLRKKIGRRIVEHEQKGVSRAQYGKQLLPDLSKHLTKEFGRGFSERNLEYMRKFYLLYANRCIKISQMLSAKLLQDQKSQTVSGKSKNVHVSKILQTPSAKFGKSAFSLNWSQYVFLIGIKDDNVRGFYEIEASGCLGKGDR